jgi:alginate O-acetyltransferase complex protein AlgI
MGIILTTYFIVKFLQKIKDPTHKKILLLSGISINVAILLYFKYFNFFLESFQLLFSNNRGPSASLQIIAPIGVSFYTFRFISYLVDAYKDSESNEICRYSLVDFMIYGTFFPIIVCGPISRAKHFIPQLRHFKLSISKLYQGYRLFAIGLFLKVFVADRIAQYINFFYENHKVFNSTSTWLAVLAYDLQIYCDFAGYSSMAIGLALSMGIHIETNFNMPYIALNISDFWKRWHITLSEWIKDYLYIPLGGNRKGETRKYINLLIAMTICGLWHGAALTFVLWGGLHGVLLVVNHYWQKQPIRSVFTRLSYFYSIVSWVLTFLSVSLCWIFFRAESIDQAMEIFHKLFVIDMVGVSWYQPFVIFILLIAGLFHLLYSWGIKTITLPIDAKITPTVLFCLIWLVIVFFPKEFQPFVYAQF